MAQTPVQKRINKLMGQAKNQNGAGYGGRKVAKRTGSKRGNTVARSDEGKPQSQFGTRNQKRADIIRAFGRVTRSGALVYTAG